MEKIRKVSPFRDWGAANPASSAIPANAGAAILPPAAGNDDGYASDSTADSAAAADGGLGASATAAAGPAPARGGADGRRSPAPARTDGGGAAAAVDPADAEAAAAYAAAVDSGGDIQAMPNLDDYTTWAPDTWSEVDYDKIPFPTDPMQSICSVRSYMAVAMILWYDLDLRAKHSRAWESLTAAWKATFHTELTAGALEKWPQDGPHGFSEDQSTWLTSTLRYLKGRAPPRRRRATSPAPRPAAKVAAKPASRASLGTGGGGGASRTARNLDPVQSSRRFATLLNFNIISLISLISIIPHYDKLHILYQLWQLYTF